MRHHRQHGCGPRRGRFNFTLPEALFAMRGGSGFGPGGFDFDFNFGDGGSGRFRPSRGRRRMFESGQLRLVLLKLIADEPRHGYDLIRAIEELTGGEYAPSPGVVYPTLTLLVDMGLVEETAGEGGRKPFQVTDEGRAKLEEEAEEVERLMGRLADMAPNRDSGAAGPALGRSVKNLMHALKHRVAQDGWNEDLLNEIVDILDSAAQRIERVKPASSDQ